MPSLLNRVTAFGRSPKGQSMIRQAMSRFGGSGNAKKSRRGGRTAGGRTRSVGRARTMRKR